MGISGCTAKSFGKTFSSVLLPSPNNNLSRFLCLKSLNLQFHTFVGLNKCVKKAGKNKLHGIIIRCQSKTHYNYGLVKKNGDGDRLSLPGGKMVLDLVAAWNDLTDRMTSAISFKSSELLLMSLKISVSLLQSLPYGEDGRPPLSKALSVACILAELQVKQLKAIMKAAADLASLHLQDLPKESPMHIDTRSQVFKLFDKNEDGLISMEELKEIMEELGADKEDAHELMQLVDANSDGSLSSAEFSEFQRQVRIFQNLEGMDEQCGQKLDKKLHCFQIDRNGSSSSSLTETFNGNSSSLIANAE